MHLMNVSAILAMAPPAKDGQQPNMFATLVPMVLIFIIFYFILIRPQQKKAKEQQEMLKTVKSGDKVVTTSGIHGVITNVKDTTVIVKVADNVKLEMEKSHIDKITRPETTPDSDKLSVTNV